MTGIVVTGASGRMGRALVQSVVESDSVSLINVTVRSQSPLLGHDASELVGCKFANAKIVDCLDSTHEKPFVVIDFTTIEATLEHISWCEEKRVPLVIGTTGFSKQQEVRIKKASKMIPIVYAPNFSVGINVVFDLLDRATRILGDSVDIEILEAHHRNKVDAPSGTALALGKIVSDARGTSLNDVAAYSRVGQIGSRKQGQLGFATLRAGDIVGEHTVLFAGESERVEIAHKASSRSIFANGAVRAATWVSKQKSGLFSMRDVLGLDV